MSARIENLKRRRLRCLRCGKLFWTDRCHRICKQCYSNSGDIFVKPSVSAEGISTLGDLPLAEELTIVDEGNLDEEPVEVLDE